MIPDAPEAQTQTPPEIRQGQAEADGKVIIFFPVHEDFKNAVAGIKFWGKKKGERGVAAYHQLAGTGEKGTTYVGTGQYKLGCEIIEAHLEEAKNKGIIKDVVIHRNLTATNPSSGSIVLEEKITQAIEIKVRQQEQQTRRTQ